MEPMFVSQNFETESGKSVIVRSDPSTLIPVPLEIATCPECESPLMCLPEEFELLDSDRCYYGVAFPTLRCRAHDAHGVGATTDEWCDTDEAVGEWFTTIVVKLPYLIWVN